MKNRNIENHFYIKIIVQRWPLTVGVVSWNFSRESRFFYLVSRVVSSTKIKIFVSVTTSKILLFM